ncbi:hypothetical protein RB195_018071 [Necator americanus]|uniref:Uncharacterized protein n=1 Tax=Necator americanus TaxID=51031 RepID=A0ABR1C821_NECAM
MKNGKSGGDDGIVEEMQKSLPHLGFVGLRRPSVQYRLTKRLLALKTRYHNSSLQEVIRQGIQELLRNISAACNVEGSEADHLGSSSQTSRRNHETDEQALFRPVRWTIDEVFIVRRVIEA